LKILSAVDLELQLDIIRNLRQALPLNLLQSSRLVFEHCLQSAMNFSDKVIHLNATPATWRDDDTIFLNTLGSSPATSLP